MLLRGFTDALMMRAQRRPGAQRRRRFLPHHYDQLFTSTASCDLCGHATGHGLMNFVVPLQIGARCGLPFLNNFTG
jgi:cytochrome o ubiquinol oxidase subunit 1